VYQCGAQQMVDDYQMLLLPIQVIEIKRFWSLVSVLVILVLSKNFKLTFD